LIYEISSEGKKSFRMSSNGNNITLFTHAIGGLELGLGLALVDLKVDRCILVAY